MNHNDEQLNIEVDTSELDNITTDTDIEVEPDTLRTKLDLEIKISEKTINSSVLNITWCITPELMNIIKKSNQAYYIVFSVVKKEFWYTSFASNYETRKVAPLSDLMAYVPVERPGENYVVATIVDSDTAKMLIDRGSNSYFYNFYNFSLEARPNNREFNELKPELSNYIISSMPTNWSYDIVAINVPQEVFAKPPPLWEQDWVNYMFDVLKIGKSFDQCSFRRRRLIAHPFMLIWSTLIIAMRFVKATFFVGLGIKIKPKSIYKVISCDWSDVEYNESDVTCPEDTIKWNVIPFVKGDLKHLGAIFTPWFYIAYIWVSAVIGNIYTLGIVLLSAALFILALMFLLSLDSNKFNFIKWFANKIVDYLDNLEKERIKEAESTLVCNGHDFKSIKDLPRHKRTIKLRFQELKSQVCKPFAK